MRTTQRLRAIKAWAQETLCAGRMMKAPAQDFKITEVAYQEPKVFLGFHPTRPNAFGLPEDSPVSTCPGVLIVPNASRGRFFHRRAGDTEEIHRPGALGQTLSISILFSVYEPGIRLPGFIDSEKCGKGTDMSLLLEGSEAGVMTLMDWMDDCKQALIQSRAIPHSDLIVDETSIAYALYTEEGYVVDKQPLFYGFVNVDFHCYADDGVNPAVDSLLT